MKPLGISSSSLPGASFEDLTGAVAAGGGTCVDLRADRGQRWEDGRSVAQLAGRFPVAFVGTSVTLGAVEGAPPPGSRFAQAVEAGLGVRCFVVEELRVPERRTRALRDVAGLRRAHPGCRILVEGHRPAPDLGTLAAFAEVADVDLVVDTLGLARLGATAADVGDLAGRRAAAVQVKGFVRREAGWRHVPLASSPLGLLLAEAAVAAAPDGTCVTVETKAGSALADLRLLAGSGWSGAPGPDAGGAP